MEWRTLSLVLLLIMVLAGGGLVLLNPSIMADGVRVAQTAIAWLMARLTVWMLGPVGLAIGMVVMLYMVLIGE